MIACSSGLLGRWASMATVSGGTRIGAPSAITQSRMRLCESLGCNHLFWIDFDWSSESNLRWNLVGVVALAVAVVVRIIARAVDTVPPVVEWSDRFGHRWVGSTNRVPVACGGLPKLRSFRSHGRNQAREKPVAELGNRNGRIRKTRDFSREVANLGFRLLKQGGSSDADAGC